MQLFECLVVTCLALMLISVQRADWQLVSHILLLLGVVLILLNSIFEIWRWPMLLIYPGFMLLACFIIAHVRSPAAVSVFLSLLTVLPTLLAILLLAGLPLSRLPAPQGSYVAGLSELHVEDISRMETWAQASPAARTLYVKVWYPGSAGKKDEGQRVGLWEEIISQPQFKTIGTLLGFLSSIKTHSYRDLAVATGDGPFPVLVYNHAMVSWPSENSLLLEHLASHGYIIFSISHVNQMAAYRNMASSPAGSKADSERLLASISAAGTEEEQARIGLEYFEAAQATNDMVESRMQDVQFLLHYLQDENSAPEALKPLLAQADFSRIGALGHSLGGAVSTEFCKADHSCRAVANLDGGGYGHRTRQALQTPYLMISSTPAGYLNEYQRLYAQNPYYDFIFHAARHGDFSDQASILPLLKWLHYLGKANADELLAWKNKLVLTFFDHYLKDAGDTAALFASSTLFDARRHNVGQEISKP